MQLRQQDLARIRNQLQPSGRTPGGRRRAPARRRPRPARPVPAAAAGAGLGAGLMYLLDPDRGRRRRAQLADQAARSRHDAAATGEKTARDLRNRGVGMVAATRQRLTRRPPGDRVLAERVRAELGRVSRTPGAVSVFAEDGTVELEGMLLRDEHERVRRSVASVPGVREVTDRLEIQDGPGNIPALQGAVGRAPEPKPEYLQRHWSPGARLVAGTVGGGLATFGLTAGGLAGVVTGASGVALLARALTNLRLAQLTSLGTGREPVAMEKTIRLDAPPEHVWALWSDYERFPEFMTNVQEVRVDGGRSHWTVRGPLGVTASWDAEVTQEKAGELLAWRTLPGSVVTHTGRVSLEPDDRGGTHAHVYLSYQPVGGVAGLAVSSLFGANPKQQLDQDLLRMKTLVETGRPPHDATRPARP